MEEETGSIHRRVLIQHQPLTLLGKRLVRHIRYLSADKESHRLMLTRAG